MWYYLLIPAVAALVTYAVTPWVMALAHRWGVVQPPKRERDIHRTTIARMGGLAMVIGFSVAVILVALLPVPRTDPGEGRRLAGLLVGGIVAGLGGILDDRYDLSPGVQAMIHLMLGTIALLATIWIKHVNNPFAEGFFWDPANGFPMAVVIPVTLFWFFGAINTVNFLDGLDGLAAGVTAIASAIFAIHMISLGQTSVALLPLALMGATLGFLPFNRFPARVFMGSAGAYFLGYALAATAIIAGAKIASLLLVLAVPILDTAWLIVSRLQRGQHPMHGGRDHLHHRLYDAGFSQRQIVWGYWLVTALTGALALSLPGRLAKLYMLATLSVVAFVVLWALARRARRQ